MTERGRYWQELIEACGKSGQTQAEFCRRRGINSGTFAWWALTWLPALSYSAQLSDSSSGLRSELDLLNAAGVKLAALELTLHLTFDQAC